MNSRVWYQCNEENEDDIELFEQGLQIGSHSVIDAAVYNTNEQKILA